MRKLLLAALAVSSLPACAYRPEPYEQVIIVDRATDVAACRRLAPVSPTVLVDGGEFAEPLEVMLKKTADLGGTELLLVRTGRDWSKVRGTAYHCVNRELIPPFPSPKRRSVVTAKG